MKKKGAENINTITIRIISKYTYIYIYIYTIIIFIYLLSTNNSVKTLAIDFYIAWGTRSIGGSAIKLIKHQPVKKHSMGHVPHLPYLGHRSVPASITSSSLLLLEHESLT